ncbi:hypothetical protein HK099_002580 [Clydaea vesicula]|uniref:Uncharacterized protein n=1 Tax=Clydaea vesicula TaxID=447962 RepID=A0AAD5U2H7_9FUNG|nr:hypothetical protein HK099_002580 [Clydaea vesicula]KAJ3390619.1 hypothetical protein HDU92_000372 [Lobulomyces angularis]
MSSLQILNTDLVKGLNELKKGKDEIEKKINLDKEKKSTLEKEKKELELKLSFLESSLKKKQLIFDKYCDLINETEKNYSMIVQSSKNLLDVLKKEKTEIETNEVQ